MGRYKAWLMEQEEERLCNLFAHVPRKWAHIDLLDNKLIKACVLEHDCYATCDYSGKHGRAISLKTLVECIKDIIDKYYEDAANAGLGWDSGFDKDDDDYGQDPENEFHMEQGGYILPPGKTIHTDMRALLLKNNFKCSNDELLSDICDAFGKINLVQRDPYGLSEAEEQIIDWHSLAETAKKMTKEGKTFQEIANSQETCLCNLVYSIQRAPYPLLVEKILTLYRCVPYTTQQAEPISYSQVTSAPSKYAGNGRMNQQGVSMFYGGFDKGTSIKEACNDHEKKYAYLGKFKTKHLLHLLDLTGIRHIISIFEQDEPEYYTLQFLSTFCYEISLPVNGNVEEYIPTQLVTDFFRITLKHYISPTSSVAIDGILYTSAKHPENTNAVLFYDNNTSSYHLELLECEKFMEGESKGLIEFTQ